MHQTGSQRCRLESSYSLAEVSDTARSDKRVNARHVVSTPESTGGWQGRACVHAPQGSPAGAWGAQGQNPESQGQSKERKRSSRAAEWGPHWLCNPARSGQRQTGSQRCRLDNTHSLADISDTTRSDWCVSRRTAGNTLGEHSLPGHSSMAAGYHCERNLRNADDAADGKLGLPAREAAS